MSPQATFAERTRAESAPLGARAAGCWPGVSHAACLLLSHDDHRRLWLRSAATSAGWQVADFHSAADSAVFAVRNATPLALLDLPREPQQRVGFDDLVRVIRSNTSNLLVVCGTGGEIESELWARQRGAWLYLPDATEQDDLCRVFREAKSAFEKVSGAGYATT